MKILREKKVEKKTEQEKVEERREEVLKQGRKFKYPLQYAKHKLVINTILIAVGALVVLGVAGWAMLYKFQNTNDVLYRTVQVLPVPVAKVDGEKVKFSDYLMIFRGSMIAVEQQAGKLGNNDDAEMLRNEYKRAALTDAEDYTYALKLGKELGVTVSNDEVEAEFAAHRKVGGTERSEESFLRILSENFGMSKREYKRMLYLSLMREKVEIEIDETAAKLVTKANDMLKSGKSMEAVANSLGDAVQWEATGGMVDAKNIDGGRATKAMSMEAGKTSEAFLSDNGDGYYFVKLIAKNNAQVNYESLKIVFTEFDNRMAEIREKGLVSEYITFE